MSETENLQPQVLLYDQKVKRWLHFEEPLDLLVASSVEEVRPLLRQVQDAIDKGGMWAAGFIAYEAAPAFDAVLQIQHAIDGFPLAWFGLFEEPQASRYLTAPAPHHYEIGDVQPSISEREYQTAIRQIKDLIAAGDTYQVNYTLRLLASFSGDARALFAELQRAQGQILWRFYRYGTLCHMLGHARTILEQAG